MNMQNMQLEAHMLGLTLCTVAGLMIICRNICTELQQRVKLQHYSSRWVNCPEILLVVHEKVYLEIVAE